METVKYEKLDNDLIPVKAIVGEFETPVWIQQKIANVDNAPQLNYSGCGHCSNAMALNLRGIKVTPWDEYSRCLELFGKQGVAPNGNKQYPFLSVTGAVKVLVSYGLKAKAFGVVNGDRKSAVRHVVDELKKGRIVSFISCPSEDYKENPFSTGNHWVVAVGFDKTGKIVVLNSSKNGKFGDGVVGINLVTEEEIEKALSKVASPTDKTWGELENLDSEGCGYVVIE